MAENSLFWTTGGATGDQVVSYTQAHWSTASSIMSACSGFEGVAPGYLNSLAITYISSTHCHVASGGAIVDGKIYVNDADGLDVTIPVAGAGTVRLDRIVLRCSWAGFATRVTVLTGTAVAYPALTQTSGTTYDIALYKASVTDAGVVTLTDERTMAQIWRGPAQGSLLVQYGVCVVTLTSAYNAYYSVTFATAFASNPYIYLTGVSSVSPVSHYTFTLEPQTVATTGFDCYAIQDVLRDHQITVNWLAIGKK